MQFGFPRDRQLRYADFARLRPAQKRGRAFMYLKLATLYTKYCRTYRPKFFRTVAMVAAVLGAGAVKMCIRDRHSSRRAPLSEQEHDVLQSVQAQSS